MKLSEIVSLASLFGVLIGYLWKLLEIIFETKQQIENNRSRLLAIESFLMRRCKYQPHADD